MPHASPATVCGTATSSMQEGDIIFTAAPHYLYRKVADATGSRTSHVGIVFRGEAGDWLVAESKVPLSRYTPLEQFLARSDGGWFELRRLKRGLSVADIALLRRCCDLQMNRWYHLGFRYDSRRTFCSKFVYNAFRTALDIEIGDLETFGDLLQKMPRASTAFWRLWYFGRIPWQRRTVTPASQLVSPLLAAP